LIEVLHRLQNVLGWIQVLEVHGFMAEQMGGGYHGGNTIRHGQAGHFQGIFQGLGTVVDAGQNVGMQVNQRT